MADFEHLLWKQRYNITFYALLLYKELVKNEKHEPTSSILYPLIYFLNEIAIYGLRPQINFSNYEDMCLTIFIFTIRKLFYIYDYYTPSSIFIQSYI